jgi:hypothetical protein
MTKLEIQMAEALRELLAEEPDAADSRTAFVWENARTALNRYEYAEVQPKHSQMLRLQSEATRLAQEIAGDPRGSVTVQANYK